MGSPLLLAQILDTVSKIFVDITILLLEHTDHAYPAQHHRPEEQPAWAAVELHPFTPHDRALGT